MNQQSRGGLAKRALALVGVAALALVGTVAMSSAAYAAPANLPTTGGTLTIHKYEQPTPPGAPGTGAEITPPAGWSGVGGVTFTIQRITDVDLTTNAGWDQANVYAANPSSIDPADLVSEGSVLTAAGGTAPAATLALGAYLITETTGPASIVEKAAPFVVTVPIPDPTTGEWNSDVHVYPKNSLGSIDKSVTAPGAYGLGATVTWPIAVKIPTLAAGQSFTDFVISDPLPAQLSYQSYTLKVDGVDVPGALIAAPVVDSTGGTFTATLVGGATDLNTYLKANAGKTITLVITTKVVAIGTAITNVANASINNTDFTDNSITRWGDVRIEKLDNHDNALEGAMFQVFESCTVSGNVWTGVGSPISVTNGGTTTSTFGSDVNGVVHIAGLYVGDTGTPANDVTQRQYCVLETAAPAGYNLATPAGQNVMVKAGATVAPAFDATFVNPQKPPVNLPLTGSTGTMLFMLGGLALILTAGGVALVAASRRRQDSTSK